MNAAISPSILAKAESIPYTHADEAHRLLTTALSRFMTLVESLHADDWSKPTACTAWNVHDMVAHQAGGYASGTSYKEMIRQYTSKPKPGQLPEDAINDLQVGERKSKTPAELIAELKQIGEVAAHNWAYGFNAIKWIAPRIPLADSCPSAISCGSSTAATRGCTASISAAPQTVPSSRPASTTVALWNWWF